MKVNSLTTLRESGKSDELIVPNKQPNKRLQGPAGAVEGRGSIKRNAKQDVGTPAQNGISATRHACFAYVKSLHRLHSGSCRPTPARRIQIPKADCSLRPLSILAAGLITRKAVSMI